MAKKTVGKIGEIDANALGMNAGRGHAFARAGKGRSTSFRDRRKVNRGTAKIRFRRGDE